MRFLKWIRTEIDPTSTNKSRFSKSPLAKDKSSSALSSDEAYSKALLKFNEWRKQKQLGTLSKKNQKHFEKMSKRLDKIKHKSNKEKNKLTFNESILSDTDFYEEIDKQLSHNTVNDKDKNKKQKIKKKNQHSRSSITVQNITAIKESIMNNTIIYENDIKSQDYVNGNFSNLDNCNKEFGNLSNPAANFYKENSIPFEQNENKSSKYENKQGVKKSLPLYQTMINKHGDVVEYAIPFTENTIDDFNQSDSIINPYAESKYELIGDISLPKTQEKNSYKEKPQIKPVIVTDLDKSNEKSGDYENINNIMKELETLEKWSKSIALTETNRTYYDENFTGIIICSMSDVKITSNDPIQLYGSKIYSGNFRGAFISEQKKEHYNISFQDEAILINFDKLRSFRHPAIALLMGVTIDSNRKLCSLILESFKCSLHNEIHRNDTHIAVNDVIKYSIQLTKAIVYCHENGLIHSNICSETILISNYNNYLKISSFELATIRDNTQNIGDCKKEIAFNFLPHLLDYRKTYSNHSYQSPELVTTKLQFIYPTNQSDIYGICLTLWEMLNKSIPFASFNYKDLENLFDLQKAILPIFEEKRCKPFKNILEKGLQINPSKRFKSAKDLQGLLMQIWEPDSTVPIDSNPSKYDRIVYEKTSTIKKRKFIGPNLSECTNTIKNIRNYSTPQHKSKDSDEKDLKLNNSKNIFEVNDFHLPTTPIARSTQLLKTAWLADETISPIQKLEKSKDPNKINLEQSDKVYNIKITISTKNDNKEEYSNTTISELADCQDEPVNNFPISKQINYWNSISSPQSNEKDLFKTTKQKIVTQPEFQKDDAIENINKIDSICHTVYEDENQSRIPIAAILNESLGKRRVNTSRSFEDSVWKQEKRICQNLDVNHNKINTVKDTVNKFESFSNKLQQNDLNFKVDSYSSKLQDNTLENNRAKVLDNDISDTLPNKEDNFLNLVKDDDITENKNLENDEIKICSMEVQLKSLQECRPKKLYKSNLDIKLDNKNIECPDLDKERKFANLNHKKITRRASDINWFCRKVRVIDDTNAKFERHSICGTRVLKRLGKFRQSNFEAEKTTEKETAESLDDKDYYKLEMGKLTCWNCGCKVFLVNDRGNGNRRLSENSGTMSPVTKFQSSKSIEDLYIDDDFYQDIVLSANMELRTEAELIELSDFNLVSPEIFNTK